MLEAFVSFPVLESFPVEFIEVLAFRVSMLNGSLDSKAIYSKDKNLQQVMSKRRKVIDNAGQDAVAGGHIALIDSIQKCTISKVRIPVSGGKR